MAALSPYTTTEAVRGCIGLTDNELLEDMLQDQSLELELEVDLQEWFPTAKSEYDTGMAGGATPGELLIANYITLYAQWFLANQALNLMVLAIPQMISDGKSEMRRFQAQDLEDIQAKVSARAARYKTILQDTQGTDTDTTYSPVTRGVPSYDPVSGV